MELVSRLRVLQNKNQHYSWIWKLGKSADSNREIVFHLQVDYVKLAVKFIWLEFREKSGWRLRGIGTGLNKLTMGPCVEGRKKELHNIVLRGRSTTKSTLS